MYKALLLTNERDTKDSTILEQILLAHLGVGCTSKSAVDDLCAQAAQAGVLLQAPQDSGYPIGYWAFLQDPDGHTLELSYGQEIGLTIEAIEAP